MTKAESAGQKKKADPTSKELLHDIKNGFVKKNKKSKFGNTSMDKLALVNNIKAQKQNAPKSFQKYPKNTSIKNNQKSPKGNKKQLKEKQSLKKEMQVSPKGSQKEQTNKAAKLQLKKELEEIDDSDSDIDEGIIPQDISSATMDETSDDEEGSDTDVPDIFEKSLADESDEDDEDFEDENEENEEKDNDDDDDDNEDDDEEMDDSDNEERIEHKGVKMFKGIKSKTKNESLEAGNDEDDDDVDDEDDDIDSNKMDTSNLEVDEEEEDDTDDDDEESEEGTDISLENIHNEVYSEDDEEDDDDDENDEGESEDEEEDEEVEDEGTQHSIKALLGKTITDDEDDEDFNEEDEDDEDDDISDEDEDEEENDMVKVTKEKETKVSKNKDSTKNKQVDRKELSPEEQEEIDKRTILIDNIPKETKPQAIKKVFNQYGHIENMRFRCIIPKDPKMPKKVAALTGQIHPQATTIVAYVNYKSQESAKKALSMNGKMFEGNYINVKIVAKSEQKKIDHKKAVFLGNLKFGINSNDIWKHFGECGEIESVHLVRHGITGQTKGFGYVNFKSEDAVALALKLDGTEILKRPVRVKPCLSKENIKNKGEKRKKRHFSNKSNKNASKKFKTNLQEVAARSPQNVKNFKKQQKSQKGNENSNEKTSTPFQGQKANLKNKRKTKLDKKKKAMAEKLATKPKKPVKV